MKVGQEVRILSNCRPYCVGKIGKIIEVYQSEVGYLEVQYLDENQEYCNVTLPITAVEPL